jgi:predicted DNA-binding protein
MRKPAAKTGARSGRGQKTKAGSRTMSVRLPNSHADRLNAEAEAKCVSKSALITEALYGRMRPPYPALAALARIIEIAQVAKRSAIVNDATIDDLRTQIQILRELARGEVFG